MNVTLNLKQNRREEGTITAYMCIKLNLRDAELSTSKQLED